MEERFETRKEFFFFYRTVGFLLSISAIFSDSFLCVVVSGFILSSSSGNDNCQTFR